MLGSFSWSFTTMRERKACIMQANQAHQNVVGAATAAQEAAMYPVITAARTVNDFTTSYWRVGSDTPTNTRENGHAMTPLLSSIHNGSEPDGC